MTTLVELISATDTIVFAPVPDVSGFVYDNATLEAWYRLPKTAVKPSKRPNAHGTYKLGQVFTDGAEPVVVGQYFGAGAFDALQARQRLSRMFNDGRTVTMRVSDELGVTTREVQIVDFFAPFHLDFSHFHFDLACFAPDPRRYGPTFSKSIGLPTVSGGLVWPLGSSGTGLFWDWGTPGVTGQVDYTNTGGATTFPRLEIGAGGAFDVGFRITEVETGRELTLERPTSTGEIVTLNSRTQRATIDGADVTGRLSSREWFEIPSGVTRTYQINPLGSVTGAPTMTIYAAPADL